MGKSVVLIIENYVKPKKTARKSGQFLKLPLKN